MNSIASHYESDVQSDSEDGDEVAKVDYFGLQSSETDGEQEDSSQITDNKLNLSYVETMINAYEHSDNFVGPSNVSKDDEIRMEKAVKRRNKVVNDYEKSPKKVKMKVEEFIDKLTFELKDAHPLIHKHILKNHKKSFLPQTSNCRTIENHHNGCINALQWGPQNASYHLLLSASMDGYIKICDVLSRYENSQIYSNKLHDGYAVRCAQWHTSQDTILTGGFDKNARFTNIIHGVEVQKFAHSSHVNCLKFNPEQAHTFVTGSTGRLAYWDIRSSIEPIRTFEANLNEVKDVEFLPEGNELVCCSNLVTRDSADKNIMAWDLRTGAILSNQIFHERYHCTCLRVHPNQKTFLAQTNGNYIASFSVTRPYKMNKKLRYEGHKVLKGGRLLDWIRLQS